MAGLFLKLSMYAGLTLVPSVYALKFKQFEGDDYYIDTTTLRKSPNGHELHFIQDAKDNIFEWDGTNYVHHDEEKNHNDDGHHHQLIFDFEEGKPPTELQKDDKGHELIEIVNTRVSNLPTTTTKSIILDQLLYFPPPSIQRAQVSLDFQLVLHPVSLKTYAMNLTPLACSTFFSVLYYYISFFYYFFYYNLYVR